VAGCFELPAAHFGFLELGFDPLNRARGDTETRRRSGAACSLLSGGPTMREGYISAAAFPPVAALRLNRTRHLLAVDTKMAFTVASLLLGTGQGHTYGSGGADMVMP
jgi:hypothetical protein